MYIYTKKIVGYQVSDRMRASANVKALQMALKNNKAPDINHSDRRILYIYSAYLVYLKRMVVNKHGQNKPMKIPTPNV